ncbi:DEAD-box ATP-dependent RNA helicase 42-like [Haliotis rufescens]|uniref:DEAD-box ATP-dependent RNA helicase 42-like n=1 Tax=Haliotis rufescens TaxID=6454 RepID=UPI00201EB951|nr:DEAD-box ATP-dependent RNA helicase 42-like [Haliotis rufescens]XP_046359873.2 DEAD-box ATP-dependent RNA helicase 42-like [Haliotis rufescens]
MTSQNYECSKCPKIDTQRKLTEHFIRSHVTDEEAPWRCSLCNFKALSHHQLQNHTNHFRHQEAVKRCPLGIIEYIKSKTPYKVQFGRDILPHRENEPMYNTGVDKVIDYNHKSLGIVLSPGLGFDYSVGETESEEDEIRRNRFCEREGNTRERRNRSQEREGNDRERRKKSEEREGNTMERRNIFKEREGNTMERRKTSEEREGNTMERRRKSEEREGNTMERRRKSKEREENTMERRKTSEEREGNTMERRRTSEEREGNTMERRKTSEEREGNTMERRRTSEEREGNTMERRRKSKEREGNTMERRKASEEREGNTMERRKTSEEREGNTMERRKTSEEREGNGGERRKKSEEKERKGGERRKKSEKGERKTSEIRNINGDEERNGVEKGRKSKERGNKRQRTSEPDNQNKKPRLTSSSGEGSRIKTERTPTTRRERVPMATNDAGVNEETNMKDVLEDKNVTGITKTYKEAQRAKTSFPLKTEELDLPLNNNLQQDKQIYDHTNEPTPDVEESAEVNVELGIADQPSQDGAEREPDVEVVGEEGALVDKISDLIQSLQPMKNISKALISLDFHMRRLLPLLEQCQNGRQSSTAGLLKDSNEC